MNIRREVWVLLGTLLLLLALWFSGEGETSPLRGAKSATNKELEFQALPDLSLVLDRGPDAASERRAGRDLFTPPSDTQPLVPLEWVAPEAEALTALRPPPIPGPAARVFAKYLRSAPGPQVDLPDFFGGEESGGPELDFEADGEEDSAATDVRRALGELGSRRLEGDVEELPESPEERAARVASYAALYDSITLQSGQILYGWIRNPDRFALGDLARESEAIVFEQVDPRTGAQRFRGMAPIEYERERIAAFDFAGTPSNRIERTLRQLRGQISVSNYEAALEFAKDCIASRLVAPRALEAAREVCRALEPIDPLNPEPRLILARTFEAEFNFDRAFSDLNQLLGEFKQYPAVHVQMAELEARLWLYESARARYRTALDLDSRDWRTLASFGRFLLSRGDDVEAREYLEQASRLATETGSVRERVELAVDQGRAHLRLGELAPALGAFRIASRLSPSDRRAQSGVFACALLEPTELADVSNLIGAELELGGSGSLSGLDSRSSSSAGVAAQGLGQSAIGFELLYNAGLLHCLRGEWEQARLRLESAVTADALRASSAHAALSWLAEQTGHPDEALRFADLAYEGNPTDPYTLYQRGRLLADRDALEEARAAYEGALSVDIDFVDASIALGQLASQEGRHGDAEHYLRRAAEAAPERAELHALRGKNLAALGNWVRAREVFGTALERDPAQPLALCGMAWCAYRLDSIEEALAQLAELDDRRRNQPEEDPYRLWSKQQLDRIVSHAQQVQWEDHFERTLIRNAWIIDEGVGPLVSLKDGELRIEGAFARKGRVRFLREYPANAFVSIKVRLWIDPNSAATCGIFLARERERRRVQETQTEVSLSRQRDNRPEIRLRRPGLAQDDVRDEHALEFPAGTWVELEIVRSGDDSRPSVSLFLDGIPLAENIAMPDLGRAASDLRVGVFVEGDTGRTVSLRMDDVRVIYRTGERR